MIDDKPGGASADDGRSGLADRFGWTMVAAYVVAAILLAALALGRAIESFGN